jgi:HPt (histidine-containing phosphotransfer) domain-containing protein
MDQLERLPGLDLATGLRCVRGDRASYLQLLRMFIDSNRDEPDQLRRQLADGKLVVARQIAHRIKGSAITLGVSNIAALASRIDQRLRSVTEADAELLADAEQLGDAMQVLERAMNDANPTP